MVYDNIYTGYMSKLESVIVGQSDIINGLRKKLASVINKPKHVIFTSESGSQVDTIANFVHELSDNFPGNFSIVNDQLVNEFYHDDFVYGKKKGSKGEQKSVFEKARNGTLYFNDIKHLSSEKLSYLIHVMKTGQYFDNYHDRVKEIKTRIYINIDNSVARNDVVNKIISDASFINVNIPTLNSCKKDIIAIAKHEMKKALGVKNIELAEDLTALMSQYHWPGDYQEMILISRLIQYTPGEPLSLQNLPEIYRGTCTQGQIPVDEAFPNEGLEDHLKSLEIKIIKQALIETNSNISASARKLDMKRTTLIEKMKRMQITKDALLSTEDNNIH